MQGFFHDLSAVITVIPAENIKPVVVKQVDIDKKARSHIGVFGQRIVGNSRTRADSKPLNLDGVL